MKAICATCAWGILFFYCLFITGCATSSSTFLEDDSKGYRIDCSGIAVPLESCYEKAGDICLEKGYIIQNTRINKSDLAKGIVIKCR